MYRIAKTFTFAAAHHLHDLPDEHKCRRPHGHNYEVTVVLEADDLPDDGMVMDYGLVAADFGAQVRDWLDHTDLNENMALPDEVAMQPTAERLADWLLEVAGLRLTRACRVVCVRVAETPGTWAEAWA